MAITTTVTPSSDNLMLGAGSVYFDRFDNSGGSTGERHLGNCTDLSVQTQIEKVEKYSSMQSAKRLYKSVIRQIKATSKMVLDEYDLENLSLALLGTTGTLAEAGATVTDEPFVGRLGKWVKLAHRNISSSGISIKDSANATVNTSEYEVDLVTGRVKILATSTTVAEAEACKISYTALPETYPSLAGATVGKIEGLLRFIGDPTSGPKYEFIGWKASVQPDAEIGLISDDFKNFTLNVEFQDDSVNHPTCPLFQTLKIA